MEPLSSGITPYDVREYSLQDIPVDERELADRRLLAAFEAAGGNRQSATQRPYTSVAVSETIIGSSFNLTAINSTSLFGTNTKLLTTITIEGRDSGARVTVPLEISKEVIASKAISGETGITLR